MRRLIVLLVVVLAGATPAVALEPGLLTGTWVGTHDGQPLVWEVLQGDRLRVDGRPGDFEIHGDTLIVRFDAPVQTDPDPGVREVAVYHLVASTPVNGDARLFVSGFDLGKQGALLLREPEALPGEGDAEDAAPPAPSGSLRPVSQRTASLPSSGPRSGQ